MTQGVVPHLAIMVNHGLIKPRALVPAKEIPLVKPHPTWVKRIVFE